MSNNKKIEAKDYPNVFAFITAVIEAGRELQLQPQAGTGWESVTFTHNTVRACGCDLYASTLIEVFREGRLRVKTKKRTVEGWILVNSSSTKPYLGEVFGYHVLDLQKNPPPSKLEDNEYIAKITWEVEE